MFERTARLIFIVLLFWLPSAFAEVAVTSTRIWPAQDYTRLTLESKQPIRYNLFTLKNPERLVIDLDDVEINPALNDLVGKIGNDDPYIKSVRIGRFKPGVVRLVLDLKAQVKPQLFSLQPVAEYGHRLVLDVYPLVAIDPLMALAQQGETKFAASESAATSAVDETPGFGIKPNIAEPTMTQPAPLARTELSNRILLIAVDAGHGGEDPGARGQRGTYEKNVTLSIARRLKAQIDDVPGMRAILIRDGDYFIPLGGRVEKAEKAHADLFVSIHADAFTRSHAHGSSVFALSQHGATSASARLLAKKENDADLIGGVNLAAVKDPYLARTLVDLKQTAAISDSLKLARHVLKEVGQINTLHRGRVEQAGFAVLKSPEVPSILVETAFISNPSEELRLKDDAYQEKMARAILGGIKRYFAQNPALSKPRLAQSE